MEDSIENIIPILSELNETAVEMINQEMYEEALDSLLKAEYIITTLLPNTLRSGGNKSDWPSRKDKGEIDKTYISTIYYNLAWVWQKLSKLEQCIKYLDKAIEKLNEHCKENTEMIISENTAKLVYPKNSKSPRAAEYNDLLMKYRYLTKFNLQFWAVLSQTSQ